VPWWKALSALGFRRRGDVVSFQLAARRRLTHPLTPALAITTAAGAVALWEGLGRAPVLLAWVVIALAAGYAISGSV